MNEITRYTVEDYVIDVEFINVDQIINIPITENGRLLGRALLTREINSSGNNGKTKFTVVTVLTDIIIYNEEDRRRGLADKLMGLITNCDMFDCIVTGISTEQGRSLCLKHGFKQEEFKGKKFLIWRKKGGNNATDTKRKKN